jgi:hypothetical protein
MMVRKVVTGSVLAASLGVAGLLGAAPAFAGPGVSASVNGGDAVGIGDQEPGSGAFAHSTESNNALAISTGLAPGGASAIAMGERNNVVSIDGHGLTGPNTARNNVVTVGGATILGGDAHDNTVVNVGGVVSQQKKQKDAPGVLSLSACGTSFSGQAAHLTVSPGACGGGS